MAWKDAGDLRRSALGAGFSQEAFAEHARFVRGEFWETVKRVAGRIPFAEDAVAAYYCALDPNTPLRVRGMLFAALAYFLLPADLVPDMLPVLGYADDAALLASVLAMVAAHVTPVHRAAASAAFGKGLADPA